MENINRVLLTGNLTRDPETKTLASGTEIANLRVAVNSRVKRNDEWQDKPNYFDVTCFGGRAKFASQYLKRGSAIALDGRLDYQEWENDAGEKRNRVLIIADNIQGTDKREGGGPREQAPDPEPVGNTAGDDDIPF